MIDDMFHLVEKNLYDISKRVTGPVLLLYVCWIIAEARSRGLKRLYFLARDGYTLLEIARSICKEFSIDIDCRYLYCSRASLRMPSYHLIGDEAFDLLLLGGYHVTVRTLLDRARLTEEERMEVYKDIVWVTKDENKELSKMELFVLAEKLRASSIYRSIVIKKSRDAYDATIGYLKQEGLLDGSTVAIVDSGWTGSMQRSLRQLINSASVNPTILGFYFGMFRKPRESADGDYLCWFFNSMSSKRNKLLFVNNVFECMLSAPHSMTESYIQSECGIYQPVMKPFVPEVYLQLTNTQRRGIMDFVCKELPNISLDSFDVIKRREVTSKILGRIMTRPTKSEAVALGAFGFCDDITESYQISLADETQIDTLKGYMLLPRIWNKLIFRSKFSNRRELFWPYGTIAFLPRWKQWWYRLNVLIWEWIRYSIDSNR